MADVPVKLAPVVSLLWHGHHVEVFGDQDLVRRSGTRHADPIGVIAVAIDSAASYGEMAGALRQSTIGETHDVVVAVAAWGIEVRLRTR